MIDIRTTCKRYSIEDEFIKKIISILGIKYLMAPPCSRTPWIRIGGPVFPARPIILNVYARKIFEPIADQKTDPGDAETQKCHFKKTLPETFAAHHGVIVIKQRDHGQCGQKHNAQCHDGIRKEQIGNYQNGDLSLIHI